MWGPLCHPRHVEFYKDFHLRQRPEDDWMPMSRAVQHLRSLPDASKLYAFTSLWRFHVTTSPTFHEHNKHASVEIVWRWNERMFYLAFGSLANGWLDDRSAEVTCDEAGFPSAGDPFLHRLLASVYPGQTG